MPYNFEQILENRQSNRPLFESKNKECLGLHDRYVSILNWINKNESLLLAVMPELISELSELKSKVTAQKNSIEAIIGSERAVGRLQNLLSRIEREWISFAAVGAKRQGKGHTLSTLLGLLPENDIFLARKGKPCTATVVTLHQGPKRKPVFNANNQFVEWVKEGENKAYVYCYTFDEIVATIQKYFNIIGLVGNFSPADSSYDSFVAECDRWYAQVSTYVSPTGQTEYVDLLKEYLGQARKYARLLKESVDSVEPVEPIVVNDIELVNGSKVDFRNDELRKYISYYRRGIDEPFFDVLAVKKVEIYTNYTLGGLNGGSFVIGDTAGVGEFKINLIDTLRGVLKNDIDIAIGVTKVPTDENGDLGIPQDVINYHNAIKGCFISTPHQFYYIINATKQAKDSYTSEKIEGFRKAIIADLRQRAIIPSVGDKKYEDNTPWTPQELLAWENSHVVILDSDNFDEVNAYLANVVLPQVSLDLSIIDKKLLEDFSADVEKQKEAWKEITAMIKAFVGHIPCNETDVDTKKREEIMEKILIPMREELKSLRTALTKIGSLQDKVERDEKYPEIHEAIALLAEFEKEFMDFYYEPDCLRCLTCIPSPSNPDDIFSSFEREACRSAKKRWYDEAGSSQESLNLKAVEEWYKKSWTKGAQKYTEMVTELKCVLSATIDSIDDDEMRNLVEYRSVLVKHLESLTKQMFTDKAEKAYQLIINLIWKLVAEYGRFNQNSNESVPMNMVLGSLAANASYGCKVIGCFTGLELKELCAAPGKLSNDLSKLLAKSKIQPVIYTTEGNSPAEMLAKSFADHLMSIEQEYKKRMALRFKGETLLGDFQASFYGVISKLSNYLLPQTVTLSEPYASTQAAFMNYCMAEFDKLFPGNKYMKIKALSISIVELQNMI